MSYILDALKKSESERQRQDAPGFADVPVGTHAGRMPTWVWLLIGLLVSNALILAFVMLRGFSAGPSPAGTQAEPVAAMPGYTGTVQRDHEPAAALPATPVPIDRSTPPARRTPLREPAPTPAPAREQTASLPEETPSTRSPDPASAASLPTLFELNANGSLQLPDLHLDIHVYSATSQDRFVFVNMSKYREGERITEGPLVREIVPEGVILEYRDTAFLLPRE